MKKALNGILNPLRRVYYGLAAHWHQHMLRRGNKQIRQRVAEKLANNQIGRASCRERV